MINVTLFISEQCPDENLSESVLWKNLEQKVTIRHVTPPHTQIDTFIQQNGDDVHMGFALYNFAIVSCRSKTYLKMKDTGAQN